MSTAKEKTLQVIVVRDGPPTRPAVEILTSPAKPNWISLESLQKATTNNQPPKNRPPR